MQLEMLKIFSPVCVEGLCGRGCLGGWVHALVSSFVGSGFANKGVFEGCTSAYMYMQQEQ